jgi:hypothetical protein
MKKALFAALAVCLFAGFALAAPMKFPGTIANARYVYVTSYDGNQYDPGLLPQDRQAISSVQDSIQKWGKLVVVYRPQDADVVLMVQSRPSEDLIAVYDARQWPQSNYLWRVMGRDGLQRGETPLVTQFQKAFDQLQK